MIEKLESILNDLRAHREDLLGQGKRSAAQRIEKTISELSEIVQRVKNDRQY